MGRDRCELLCLDLPKAEALRETRLGAEPAAAAAARAGALGDPTRLTLAAALAEGGELCVCDLSWIAERAENLVSHHLRVLRAAGRRQLAAGGQDGALLAHTGRAPRWCAGYSRLRPSRREPGGRAAAGAGGPDREGRVAAAGEPGEAPLLAVARLHGRGGRSRRRGRGGGGLDRSGGLRDRLGDRGLREPRHRLALHRLALALSRRRAEGAAAGGDPVLRAGSPTWASRPCTR